MNRFWLCFSTWRNHASWKVLFLFIYCISRTQDGICTKWL